MALPYRDRRDAGRQLAEALAHYAGQDKLLVLGLPRGGVPVAAEVARALHAPLDILVVRKLGYPGFEELAMGAIASGGAMVLNPGVVAELGGNTAVIEAARQREQLELERREQAYRGDRPALDLHGRQVILVDDGLATGSTMRAAAMAARQQQAARVVVAIPVAPGEVAADLRGEVDEVVCLATPPSFMAVGQWYLDFSQTEDAEVRRLLAEAAQEGR